MQNAGISPEAVSRKGREERNKENRQRDSRIIAGLRNEIAERDCGCNVRCRFGRTERCWRKDN